MQIARLRPLIIPLVLFTLTSCGRGPTRDEALAAIRAARPGLDTATVYARVWQDGPPWFSCAEVTVKLRTGADSAVVRDQVGNWAALARSGWVVLKDSASGIVADPGWCTLRPTPAGMPNIARWRPAPGPPFPTGHARRGWTMIVGRQRLLVPKGASSGADSATAEYALTVAPNPDGVGVGADRDTAWFIAELRKVQGKWQMSSSRRRPASP